MAPQSSHIDSSSPEEAPDESTEALEPSKSQRKREADEIRDFARDLTTLPPRKLKILALPPDIEEAIRKCPPTSTRGAHKRHLQFISKLLRKNGDVDEIKSRLENPPVLAANNDQPHKDMRDALIAEFADNVETLKQAYPTANLQKVRQLVRQANAAESTNSEDETKNNTTARKKAEKARKSLLALLRESSQA